ncbi:MAG: DUF2461 domain-containing protein [Longimicrobiales bacterium]|nr:DUF2461 domain-containing protein [Longimicrobiales bacterium]
MPFTSATFDFLRELAANNERAWFQENRARYQRDVRAPAVAFILAVGEALNDLSPHLRADPRPVGGSLFRIHRDVRFARDKRPYKTSVGVQFRHARGRDAHAPGLYLHIEPGACFVGLGVWRPSPPALRAIRDRLVEDPAGWRAAVSGKPFRSTFSLDGEGLSRAPRGYDPGHPLIEDLKRKDFVAVHHIPDDFVTAPSLPEDFLRVAGAGEPFLRYLCGALDVPF